MAANRQRNWTPEERDSVLAVWGEMKKQSELLGDSPDGRPRARRWWR